MQFKMSRSRTRCNGFTLVELITVIGIISVLMGLLLPAVQAAREAARRVACNNNVRNLVLATQTFETSHRIYPVCSMNDAPNSSSYTRDTSPFRQLLPFLEQTAIANAWDDREYSFGPKNSKLAAQRLSILNCPSSTANQILQSGAMKFGSVAVSGLDLWYADYAGNANSNDHVIGNQQITRGMFAISIETFSLNRVKHSDVVDGTSNTILYWESLGGAWFNRRSSKLLQSTFDSYPAMGLIVVVRDRSGVPQAYPFATVATIKSYLGAWAGFRVGGLAQAGVRPINWENRSMEPFSLHTGSFTIGFVDGQVQNVSEQIDREVLVGLSTRDGHETAYLE